MNVGELKRILSTFVDDIDVMVCVNEAGYPEPYMGLRKAQVAQINDDGDGLYEADPGEEAVECWEMVLLLFPDEAA